MIVRELLKSCANFSLTGCYVEDQYCNAVMSKSLIGLQVWNVSRPFDFPLFYLPPLSGNDKAFIPNDLLELPVEFFYFYPTSVNNSPRYLSISVFLSSEVV